MGAGVRVRVPRRDGARLAFTPRTQPVSGAECSSDVNLPIDDARREDASRVRAREGAWRLRACCSSLLSWACSRSARTRWSLGRERRRSQRSRYRAAQPPPLRRPKFAHRSRSAPFQVVTSRSAPTKARLRPAIRAIRIDPQKTSPADRAMRTSAARIQRRLPTVWSATRPERPTAGWSTNRNRPESEMDQAGNHDALPRRLQGYHEDLLP